MEALKKPHVLSTLIQRCVQCSTSWQAAHPGAKHSGSTGLRARPPALPQCQWRTAHRALRCISAAVRARRTRPAAAADAPTAPRLVLSRAERRAARRHRQFVVPRIVCSSCHGSTCAGDSVLVGSRAMLRPPSPSPSPCPRACVADLTPKSLQCTLRLEVRVTLKSRPARGVRGLAAQGVRWSRRRIAAPSNSGPGGWAASRWVTSSKRDTRTPSHRC